MLEKAIQNFKAARHEWLERQGCLELELSIASDGETKFTLRKQIEKCKKECERLQREIEGLLELHQSKDSLILDGVKPSDILLVQNKQPMNRVGLPRDERVNPCQKVSAHLTIAVFQDLQKKQSIRILPELYYDDPKEPEIAVISLVEDTCSEAIANFPNFLQGLVKYVTKAHLKPRDKKDNSVQLTIYLFLPVEVLCYSLKQWCSESSNLATSYTVVVGCSDRFNPDRDDSWMLHNQLKKGWERLSESATALRQVKWIQPDESFNGDLERYAGLQCFGHWLKSGEKYLDRWKKLVESGIPLALWMCEVEADREAIAKTFDWLTDCDRSTFLQRVRQERREPYALSVAHSGYHLGVFYEDPNYVPTVLPQDEDEQFFSWPQ